MTDEPREDGIAGAKQDEETAAAGYGAKHLELLRVASDLFADNGYHDTSIRDLARATGRSLSGLYYYFSGKDELLFQIQDHCYGALLASAKMAMRDAPTPHARLIAFIAHHIAFFRDNMSEMKVLAHEDLTLRGEYGERVLELKRRYSRLLIDLLTEHDAALPGHRPDPDVSAFILFGMMNWIYTWPRRLRTLPAETLALDVAQIFLCGYRGCMPDVLQDVERRIQCPPTAFWKPPQSTTP